MKNNKTEISTKTKVSTPLMVAISTSMTISAIAILVAFFVPMSTMNTQQGVTTPRLINSSTNRAVVQKPTPTPYPTPTSYPTPTPNPVSAITPVQNKIITVSNIKIENAVEGAVYVSWTSSDSGTSDARYSTSMQGLASAQWDSQPYIEGTLRTYHTRSIGKLVPNTKYYFEIRTSRIGFESKTSIREFTPAKNFLRGDANQDGVVDISDTVAITGFVYDHNTLACLDAADTNDDGYVNMPDANYLQSWLFTGGKIPPAPGPYTKGTDPTVDSIGCGGVEAAGGGATKDGITTNLLFWRGDVNGDNAVDINDVAILSGFITNNISIKCNDAGDVNDDGFVTNADVTYLLNYLFKGGSAIHSPFGAVGLDLTPDGIGCMASDAPLRP